MAKVATVPNDLEPFWMPFTANRSFKRRPRLITGAKDMHYITVDGRRVIDGSAGLWCTNAGHNRDPIVHAIQRQAAELDFALPLRGHLCERHCRRCEHEQDAHDDQQLDEAVAAGRRGRPL